MRVKLSDITRYSKGVQINGDELIDDGKFAYLNGGINPSGRWNAFNVCGNTVTISEGGNSSGYINYLTEPFWCGAHCYYLYDGPKNSKYLYYALKSQQDRMFNIRSGACMPNIKKSDLGNFEFEFDFDEDKQTRIVSILSTAETIITQREKELKLFDELIKARFDELFGQGNHKMVKASEVCDFITKGTTPSTGVITEEYEEGKIPFLKVYNLSFTGEMLFDDNPQYIPKETHNGKLTRSKVYPNDVLMNIVGPPLGKFAIVTDEFDEWNINQAVAIFRAKERILPRFLLHALMQPSVLEPFISQAVGVRQQNLSLEQCRNLQFPLPSLAEQKDFVEFDEQLNKSKSVTKDSLSQIQLLFDSLLKEYFG